MSIATRIGVIGCGSVSDKYVPHVRQLNLQGLEAEVVIGCDANPGLEDKVRNNFKVKDIHHRLSRCAVARRRRHRAGADLDAGAWPADRRGAASRQACAGGEADVDVADGGC